MNSKFFFIIAIFLLLLLAIVSTGNTSYNTAIEIKTQDHTSLTSPNDQNKNTIRWRLDLPNNLTLTIKLACTNNTSKYAASKKISKQ